MTKLVRTKEFKKIIPFCGRIQKRIYKDTGRYGLFNFGDYEFGSENAINRDFTGVYQKRKAAKKIFIVKMRFQNPPSNKTTINRQVGREKFKSAIIAWQALTAEEKQVYNERAKRLAKTGNNIFISEYMLS